MTNIEQNWREEFYKILHTCNIKIYDLDNDSYHYPNYLPVENFIEKLILQTRQELLEEILAEIEELKIIEYPREKEMTGKVAYGAGQMNMLLRVNNALASLRAKFGEEKSKECKHRGKCPHNVLTFDPTRTIN